jgi:Flp pilus assembly pilin Flp
MSAAVSTLELVRNRDLRRRRAQAGAGLVEYELLIALGALLVIAAMLLFAGNVDGLVRGSGESTSSQHRVFKPPVSGQCEAGYQGVCIPLAPPDLDCADLAGMGIPLPVTIVGNNDPHGLDSDGGGPDGDGLGC